MLRLTLTAHPAVCVPPESMFFAHMADAFADGLSGPDRVSAFVDRLFENEKFSEWGVGRAALRDRLREIAPCAYERAVAEIYRTYCRQADPDVERWGDKNPDYIYHLPLIFEHFPEAHVLHLVRDVRAVYNSYKSKEVIENWDYLNPNRLLQTVTDQWRQCSRIHQQYADHPRVTHVFYEDLVTEPEASLQSLCDAVGLSYSRDMLGFHDKNRSEQLVPSHRREWHEKTFQPVDPSRAVAWKDSLSTSEVEALELLNREPLTRFGYTLTSDPPRLRGKWLLLTRHVSHRLSRYASSLTRRLLALR
jgi:hypothetical protein